MTSEIMAQSSRASPGPLNRFTDPLHSTFSVGECTVFFRVARRGQDHIGQLCRFSEEQILDNHEITGL